MRRFANRSASIVIVAALIAAMALLMGIVFLAGSRRPRRPRRRGTMAGMPDRPAGPRRPAPLAETPEVEAYAG
jgi:hypothetical protein